MSININITFMHISRFILASKSTSLSFTFFIWIFAYIITFFMGDLCTFTHFSIIKWCAVVGWQLVYMIYGKQVMSADFIMATSRHLCRYEPSLHLTKDIYTLYKSCGKSVLADWGGWKILCQRPQLCSERSRAALYIIYIWGKIENHLNYTYANARDLHTSYR